MSYNPPDTIDNSTEDRKLLTVLNKIILELDQTKADFASGFFHPKVWLLMRDSLIKLNEFRLLLGKQPGMEWESFDTLNLTKFFRDRLKGDTENLPFDREHNEMIDELIEFLNRPDIQVRLYRDKFLHAKAYIFPNWSIVGSSNLTPHGLTENSELNMLSYGDTQANHLREWFREKWEDAVVKESSYYKNLFEQTGKQFGSYKDELIEVLEQSKFGGQPHSPYAVFIKVLYEWLKERLGLDEPDKLLGVELASFQKEGLQEAIHILEKHRGVIVSDAVGLGKTYIAMGILEYFLGKRKPGYIPRALVICPAQLRDLVWNPKLDEYGIKTKILSQEEIARDEFPWKNYNYYDIIVVDESHNFRNPGTKRYNKLHKIISTGKIHKFVVLLTATPINNSIFDLYHQVMLIARGQEGYYREYGISNILGYFQRVRRDESDLFNFLEETMVRRSRLDIKRRQQAGKKIELPGKGEIHFPTRELHVINYNLEKTYKGFYRDVANAVERLQLSIYNIEAYKSEGNSLKIQSNEALIGIMRTRFLKRIESSLKAFEISVNNQIKFTTHFFKLLKQGKLLDSPSHRKIIALEDEHADEFVENIITNLPEIDPNDYDLSRLKDDISHDLILLDELLTKVKQLKNPGSQEHHTDYKLNEFKKVLTKELKGQKVLIFSYYKDTADYLFQQLKEDKKWIENMNYPKLDKITGELQGKDREELVKRFAPIANTKDDEEGRNERDRLQKEKLDILISTDVLSEGQNLQDAGVIINYDLHWNPVRMIQRAGRVDRLGSTFHEINIYNCFPEEGLEELLGLVKRLQNRISDIDRTVGLDSSVLGEVIQEKSLEDLRRLKNLDTSVIDDLEEAFEMASLDEMKYPLMLAINEMGSEKIKEIPLGVHSWKSGERSGTFIALKIRDKNEWRFYPEDGSEPISDKRKIFRWIQSADKKIPSRLKEKPFGLIEQAVNDVLNELKQKERTLKIKEPLKGLNKKFYQIINDFTFFHQLDESLRLRLNQVLEYRNLKAFSKDRKLKDIESLFKQTQNIKAFAESLDEYFLENDLYRDLDQDTTVLEQISEENVKLICFEKLT